MNPRTFARALAALTLVALAACGGGGGGITPATPSPTATPTPNGSVSGTLTETTTGTAIAGATVTVGTLATTGTGWAAYGTPQAPTYTATTNTAGQFTIATVPPGTYFLTIAMDPQPTVTQTYAILHRSITMTNANLALGTVHIAKLSSDERVWLQDLNNRRATVSYPATGPVVVDEYAEEQARQWAADVVNGKTQYGDAGYAPYQTAYSNSAGAIGSVGGALNGAFSWKQAEDSWFFEKSNCPTLGGDGDWRTCPWQPSWGQTGHYINLSIDSDVWVGLGEDLQPAPASGGGGIGGFYTYDVMTTEYGATARTLPDDIARRVAP